MEELYFNVFRMDEYRSRVQALEIENAQLQSNSGAKSEAMKAPGTPNWLKQQ